VSWSLVVCPGAAYGTEGQRFESSRARSQHTCKEDVHSQALSALPVLSSIFVSSVEYACEARLESRSRPPKPSPRADRLHCNGQAASSRRVPATRSPISARMTPRGSVGRVARHRAVARRHLPDTDGARAVAADWLQWVGGSPDAGGAWTTTRLEHRFLGTGVLVAEAFNSNAGDRGTDSSHAAITHQADAAPVSAPVASRPRCSAYGPLREAGRLSVCRRSSSELIWTASCQVGASSMPRSNSSRRAASVSWPCR
jgi:hypothetical protein